MEPTFFATPQEFRVWLEEHHDTETELVVGFHRKRTGRPSMTWQQAVDEALCFGWIDGIRRSLDDDRYTNRFTPRRRGSAWSAVNIARAKQLIAQGRMRPAGLRAFETHDAKAAEYSYELRRSAVLDPAYERRFRRNGEAWEYFGSRAPSYRRAAIHWVMSAKREETRERRLETLIEDSARGRTVAPLTSPSRRR